MIVQHIEDRNLLVGHLAMYMEQYSEAQDHFLASSNPMAALEVLESASLLHFMSQSEYILYKAF